MLFHDFQFLSHEVLLSISVAIDGEYSDHWEEAANFHHFALLEMLQTIVPVTIFFDVANNTNARDVADGGPAQRRPHLVSFDLHEL